MTATDNKMMDQISDLARAKGSPLKILIVDDEARVRETFEDICRLSDLFEVDLAPSGEAAIEKVASSNYDLVTLDLIMPDISGMEAIEQIKKLQPRTPVMIITGNATDRLIKEAGVCGASKVLFKPVEVNSFLQGIVETIGRSRQSDSK